MSVMEPSAAGQPHVSASPGTDTTKTGGTQKPYGDRYHKPVITPGMFKGPILPDWAHSLWHRLFKSSAPSH